MKNYCILNSKNMYLWRSWTNCVHDVNKRANGLIDYLDYFKKSFYILGTITTTACTYDTNRINGINGTIGIKRGDISFSNSSSNSSSTNTVYCLSGLYYKEGVRIEDNNAYVFYGTKSFFDSMTAVVIDTNTSSSGYGNTPNNTTLYHFSDGWFIYNTDFEKTDFLVAQARTGDIYYRTSAVSDEAMDSDIVPVYPKDFFTRATADAPYYYWVLDYNGGSFHYEKGLPSTLTVSFLFKNYFCRWLEEQYMISNYSSNFSDFTDNAGLKWNLYEPISHNCVVIQGSDNSYTTESFYCEDTFSKYTVEGTSFYYVNTSTTGSKVYFDEALIQLI